MKIAFVTPTPPLRGGMVQYAAQLYAALTARGHAVDALGFRRQYPTLLFPGRSQLDPSAHPLALPARRIFDPLNPVSWLRTAAAARAARPDLLLLHYWMPFLAPGYGAIARLGRRRDGGRVVLLAHNLLSHESQPGGRALARWLLGRCDRVIVHSEAVREIALALRPDARVLVAPHPVHQIFETPLARDAARRALGVPLQAPVLLMFGHVRRYKGLELLLDAMPRVAAALPDVRLLVVGEFYVARQPYEAQIGRLGLAAHVTLEDRFVPREEVGRYFAAADLVVLPYLAATQSGIAAIAYAHERPVVATAVGGLPEQVADGETGYVVPLRADALAEAIVRYFREADRPAMADAIRARRQLATWEQVAATVEACA